MGSSLLYWLGLVLTMPDRQWFMGGTPRLFASIGEIG
jgi:hypothetical protein